MFINVNPKNVPIQQQNKKKDDVDEILLFVSKHVMQSYLENAHKSTC